MRRLLAIGCIVLSAVVTITAQPQASKRVGLSGTWNIEGALPPSAPPAGSGRALALFVTQRTNEIQVDRLVPSGQFTMYVTSVFKLDGTASVNAWGRAALDVVTTVATLTDGRLSMKSENPQKTTWQEDIYIEGKCLVFEETLTGSKPIRLRYIPSDQPRIGAKFSCDGEAKGAKSVRP